MENKTVISAEAAEKELSGIEEIFDVTLDPDSREKVLKVIMAGRLVFNEGAESFRYILRKRLELLNGDSIQELALRQPVVSELMAASQKKGDFSQAISLISAVTGQPFGIIERLGQKDFLICSALLSFFG